MQKSKVNCIQLNENSMRASSGAKKASAAADSEMLPHPDSVGNSNSKD